MKSEQSRRLVHFTKTAKLRGSVAALLFKALRLLLFLGLGAIVSVGDLTKAATSPKFRRVLLSNETTVV